MKIMDEGSNYNKDALFERRAGPVEDGSPPFWGELAWFWPSIDTYFSPGKKVLEIGPAYWPVPVAKENLTVIDKLEEHRESLLKKAARVIIGDGLQAVQDLSGEEFDIVASFHCLEHMEEPERVLDTWWTKVRPHGHLIIAVPVVWYYPSIGQHGGNTDHEKDYTLAVLLRMMLDSRLDMEIELAQVRGDHNQENDLYHDMYGDTVVSYVNDRSCLVIARKLNS